MKYVAPPQAIHTKTLPTNNAAEEAIATVPILIILRAIK